MSMYFDRINAFASPLYGFDTAHLWKDSRVHANNYETLVLDFLRRHVRKKRATAGPDCTEHHRTRDGGRTGPVQSRVVAAIARCDLIDVCP